MEVQRDREVCLFFNATTMNMNGINRYRCIDCTRQKVQGTLASTTEPSVIDAACQSDIQTFTFQNELHGALQLLVSIIRFNSKGKSQSSRKMANTFPKL